MRVVVAHSPDSNSVELRRTILGAGLDCAAADCVSWEQLPVRLAQSDADLIVLKVEDISTANWSAIQEAWAMTAAPKLIVGPPAGPEAASIARQQGAAEYLDESQLRVALDGALQRLYRANAVARPRGKVISVLAPTAGSGGTMIASNLAALLQHAKDREVALVELTHDEGDLSFLLNLVAQHTTRDVCQRWQRLDSTGLRNSFSTHASGLKVLTNGMEQEGNEYLNKESARRIAVLTRVTFDFTILSLDSRLGEEAIEVMHLSDAIVLVVRPDVVAVRRAKRVLSEVLDAGIPEERLRLVVNRWGQSGQLRLADIEASLGMKVSQFVPDDPGRVNRAINEGRLLSELAASARITRKLAKLAASLNGKPGKL